MKPPFFLLGRAGVAFVLLLGCSAAVPATEAPHYRVAVDAEYAPYEFRAADGSIRGMLPDLLREIGSLKGVTFTFQPMAWPDAVKALRRGTVDLLDMIRTPERERRYAFSEPHSVVAQALFRNRRQDEITGVDTLSGYKVAFQSHDIALEKMADQSGFRRVLVTSKAEGFAKLNSGEVAAFFAAEQPGLYFLRTHPMRNVDVAAEGLWPRDFCFAARKGNRALIALLNDGLHTLQQTGRLDDIRHKWLVQPSSWLDRHERQVIAAAVALFVVVLVLWLWVVLLRRTVEARTRSLREQSAHYHAIFDSSFDAVMLLGEQGIADCNAAAIKLFACASREELIGRHPSELSPPTQPDGEDSGTGVRKHIATAFAQGGGQFSWVCRRLDGSDFHAEISVSALTIDGKPGLQATVRDVTELRQAQQLRLLRQRMLEALLQPSQGLSAVLDAMLRMIEAELPEVLCSILLLDSEGRLHHASAPSLPDDYCKAIDGAAIGPQAGSCGTAAFTGERVVVSDIAHDPLWEGYRELAANYNLAACWSQPVFDADGKVLGTLAMYYRGVRAPQPFELDIIQLASEMAAIAILRLRSEQEKARAFDIIATSSDFVAMADSNGRALYVNPAGRAMVGIAPDADVTTMTIADFHPPEDAERLRKVGFPQLNLEGSYRTQINFVHRDGEVIPTSATFSVQKDGDGTPVSYSVIARDIRHELEQQQRMEHTQRLESLGVLAGGIAHDFNNILTAIMGNAAMAEHKCSTNPEELPRYLGNIVASSEKAAELCKQMLAYSGKGKFVVKPLDLSRMVEEITKLLEVSIAKSVVLKYHLQHLLPAVDADAAQMQQVIMNLVINASDAIGDKSGVISIDTGVMHADRAYLRDSCLDDDLPEGRYVFLEVSDTGCGMDRETQQRIFDPFFTTKFTGRGLGMSAVLGIIRGHHGTLKLYSEPGRGTVFKMLLPISDKEAAEPARRRGDDGEWRGSGTILVVDDDAGIREAAAMMLEEMGFTTLTAKDGVEGVALYQQFHSQISAVLLDMTMPRMDGKGCFSELRRINPDAKVVLSSGYNEQEATSHFSGKGLAGFVQKPYFPEALKEAMQKIL